MRPAHACEGCGHDLARVRALPEPRYGFRLVTCPHCRTHAVRNTKDLTRTRRRSVRAVRAAAIVLTGCIASLIFSLATAGLAFSSVRTSAPRSPSGMFLNYFAALVTGDRAAEPTTDTWAYAALLFGIFFGGATALLTTHWPRLTRPLLPLLAPPLLATLAWAIDTFTYTPGGLPRVNLPDVLDAAALLSGLSLAAWLPTVLVLARARPRRRIAKLRAHLRKRRARA